MALSTKVGSFSAATATGNQAITGLGFQPKLVMFFGNNQTTTGNSAGKVFAMGSATSSTDRRSSAFNLLSGDTTSAATGRGHDNTKCYYLLTTAGAVVRAADFVSNDSDGFTINWSTASATAHSISYIAFGGADVSNAKTGQVIAPASVGYSSITGLGFAPDMIMFGSCRTATTTAPPSNAVGGVTHNMSVVANNSTFNIESVDSAGTNARQLHVGTSFIQTTAAASPVVSAKAYVSNVNTDGFVLNFETTTSGAYQFFTAMKGPKTSVGRFAQPAATGSQAITGLGFNPRAIMLFSVNNIALTSASFETTNANLSFGMGTSSTQQVSLWSGKITASDLASSDLDTGAILKSMTAAASPTTEASANLTSLDSDGFTLNWTVADATARDIAYVAFGDAPAGSTGGSIIAGVSSIQF